MSWHPLKQQRYVENQHFIAGSPETFSKTLWHILAIILAIAKSDLWF